MDKPSEEELNPMLRSARWARGRAFWWRGAAVIAAGSVAVLLLAATPAVAIPVDPGGGDPPDDCVAGTTATLSVTPGTVVAGAGVAVSWSIDQVVGCTTFKWINGAGFGGSSVALSGSRSMTLTTVGTTNWSLQVSGSAGRTYTLATASVTVEAPPPPLAAVSPLAAAVDANGAVQVVMTCGDDVVLRDAQVTQGGRFAGWATAPGLLRSVASETDGSGRVVQVGFNGAGQVWGAIQDVPGGTGWVGWTAIDGIINSVALARNADGRLELFATNGVGTIFHRTQTAVGTVSFGQWSTLPGLLEFRHELARLAIERAVRPGRRMELHRRTLTALLGRHETAQDHARLVHHAEGASDPVAVLAHAVPAAERAAALGAHHKAAAQYARALRFA